MLKIDFRPDDQLLRRFGFFSVAGFGVIAFVLHVQLDAPAPLVCGVAGLGVLVGLAAAFELLTVVRPVYMVMSALGMVIGLVLGPLVLGLIYYGVFTPLALWFRVIGRDRLGRKWDPGAGSYWHERPEPGKPSSYLRLY